MAAGQCNKIAADSCTFCRGISSRDLKGSAELLLLFWCVNTIATPCPSSRQLILLLLLLVRCVVDPINQQIGIVCPVVLLLVVGMYGNDQQAASPWWWTRWLGQHQLLSHESGIAEKYHHKVMGYRVGTRGAGHNKQVIIFRPSHSLDIEGGGTSQPPLI